MKKIFSANLLKVLLLIEFIVCLALLIAFPVILNYTLKDLTLPFKIEKPVFIFSGCIYFCSIPLLIILWNIKTIAKRFSIEGYSCRKIARNFTIISVFSFLEFVFIILVQVFLWKKYEIFFYEASIVISVFVFFLCITVSFFMGVLSSAFRNMESSSEGE